MSFCSLQRLFLEIVFWQELVSNILNCQHDNGVKFAIITPKMKYYYIEFTSIQEHFMTSIKCSGFFRVYYLALFESNLFILF